ncbi:MAG: hypothetical protein U1F50_17390 [Rubrivivax sp.]
MGAPREHARARRLELRHAAVHRAGHGDDGALLGAPHAAPRREGSVHCILAWAFNTTVLALLINIGASLL